MNSIIYSQIELPVFLISLAANLALGIVIFRYAPRTPSRRYFFFFILAQIMWITANFSAFHYLNEQHFLWLSRATMLFASLHAAAFLFFLDTFLDRERFLDGTARGVVSIALLGIASASLTPLVFSHLGTDSSGSLAPQSGPAMPFFGTFVLLCVVGAIFSLVRKYLRTAGIEKIQLRYLAVGIFTTISLILVFSYSWFMVTGRLDTVRFGHLYTLPFVLFTTYAMVRHHLLNLKAIAAEVMVMLLNFILLVQVFSSPNPAQFLVNIFVFAAAFLVGILLVRAVLREIEQKEELQGLTTRLAAANAKLTDLSRFKTELLSLASHQIKSPLAAIKGYVSLLKDGSFGSLPNEAGKAVDKVQRSADQLFELVSSLLDLRKVEEGRMDYQFAKVDMGPLTRGVVEELGQLASAKKLKLEFSASAREFMVSADAQKLRQVIQNIIDNAIKYTESGSVRINLDKIAGKVILTCADTGYGMAPEVVERLFTEFMRDERLKKMIRGTGLGLYIAKKIVEAHGGTIRCESRGENQGSTFTVTLPSA